LLSVATVKRFGVVFRFWVGGVSEAVEMDGSGVVSGAIWPV
jgi:hypothetical protein